MIKEVVQFVFQGAKFFWKTRNTMDVTIVYHEHHNVTEVIMFDISLGKEAPRIYINTEALESNVEQNEIEVLQNFATMNNVPISDKFLVGIANKAKADYILKRLVITECVPPDATLVPYKTGYHQRLIALQTQAQTLEKTPEASTIKALNGQERWRIPIIFIKISHNRRLTVSDMKIWRAVTENMKTAEDAARIMAVLNQRCSGIWPTHSPAPSASMPGRLSPRRLLLNQKVPLNSPLGSSLGRSPVGQKLQTSPLRRRSVSDTEAALANTTTDPADLTSGPGSDTEVGQVSALDKSSQQQQSSRADPTTLQCPFAGLNSLKSSPRSSSGCTALSAKCEKPNCLCPSSSVVEEHSEDAGCVLKLKMPRKMTDEDFNAGICHSEPGTPVLSRQNSCENLEVTVSNKPVVIAVTAATSPTPPCDNKVTQCAAKHTPHNSLSYPHSSFSSNPSSSKSRSNSSIARDSAHLSKKKKAVFSMSVFFTCLWRWRSSRKIYVTTVDE